jgi:hypothetical protein
MVYFSGCIEEGKEKTQTLEGLRNIQVVVSRYSDDEYPTDYEGIDVATIFLDKYSSPIQFKNIPVNFTAEVYAYNNYNDWYYKNLRDTTLLYTKNDTIYGTEEDGSPPSIRIPFKDISNLTEYYERGAVKVIVKTPRQGNFTDWDPDVPLYSSQYP